MSDSEYSSDEELRNVNVLSDADTSDSYDELVIENSGILTGSRFIEKVNMSSEKIIKKNKKRLKTLVREMMTDQREFLTVSDVLCGNKSLSNDNSTSNESVMHNGKNLMTLSASSEPSKFGRKLATELFGKRSKSELAGTLIGKGRRRKTGRRDPCDPELRKKIEEVIRRKYPKARKTALREAVRAANQQGLEFKNRYFEKLPEVVGRSFSDQKEHAIVQASIRGNQFDNEVRGGRDRAPKTGTEDHGPNTSQKL